MSSDSFKIAFWKKQWNVLRARVRPHFRYIRSWSLLSDILRSPILRVVALIPAIGYTIMYSDQFHEFLNNKNTVGADLLLSSIERMHLLFFGALLILFSYFVYATRCPVIIRRFKFVEDYAAENINLKRRHMLRNAFGETFKSKLFEPSAGLEVAIDEFAKLSPSMKQVLNERFAGKTIRDSIKIYDRIDGYKAARVKPFAIARIEKWAETEHHFIYNEPKLQGALAYLFEAHYDFVRYEKHVVSRWATVLLMLPGIVMFFTPTTELILQILYRFMV